MASGSQICRGNMADFPQPPAKMSKVARVSRFTGTVPSKMFWFNSVAVSGRFRVRKSKAWA